MKSGKLSPLEPLGPVQTCTGIASPLPFTNIHNSHVASDATRQNREVSVARKQVGVLVYEERERELQRYLLIRHFRNLPIE